ncbi:D-2-hydroxyacid dehydrogenase [Poseidonibacter ostreae]|jgi:lactate dehydrogenase-like 2-hydroxyacid dehydrogenase|uniref:D-2-hydroxyacid dehydrogenase n=1 Tax=Poseidonibacter ostreae TaxID=2654171 RepID=A0A6L4WRN9_9BACT|nr:D-2-hydroxyacid dehydrogenase [Poseidonibacter ostreae]KAB7887541.1 D-2-hydroxyacid dehydrogenase [Poseidonibacter ostreae]KAB7888400.1 D-2-hydroxyacid dehydrogenase [Poseidonibacter ostreae]KAB7888659.1 D-2-hydroxyacid dehydrogenase [Poseidonibacter ostreae]MAC84487.1 hydroxyacid dehydrogenase [Arcobacter sp.]|tara:strand:+ start:2347 stop:3273 length:927 start_codon:yes stop_codon:yes gene_type:complete
MKIVILDRATLGFDVDVSIFDTLGDVISYDMTTKDETKHRVKDADIIITNKVVISKEHMDNSNIKLICISATGMNNVDLEYAKQKSIEVKNVAGYSSSSVSQVAFGMIFHFIQKLNYYKSYVDEGNWQKSEIFTHIDKPFFELDGKKVGVIGLGDIGLSFAKRAKAFDCEVVYYSTSGKNSNSEFKRVELEELLKNSDIISIHCPLNKQTEDLLNYENMKSMKDGAILLNLGRGGIINEEDLAKLIDEKEIYCGIDVVNKEPIEESNPLLKVKNKDRLLLTPHIGWASIESRTRLIKMLVKNIEEFIK